MKKHRKLSLVQSLKNKAERLWKEVCYRRDGRRCMVKEAYPFLPLKHTDVFQVDHCFSRANKHLFLNSDNGTVVCSACNQAKAMGWNSVGRRIDEITQKRLCIKYGEDEGAIRYEEMKLLDAPRKANPYFSQVWWLEERIAELEKELHDEKEP